MLRAVIYVAGVAGAPRRRAAGPALWSALLAPRPTCHPAKRNARQQCLAFRLFQSRIAASAGAFPGAPALAAGSAG